MEVAPAASLTSLRTGGPGFHPEGTTALLPGAG